MRCERANPDAYNFGLQNRDMIRAGLNALKENVQSFQTRETLHDRWRVFATWAKAELEIKDMRKLETHHLQQYAEHLRERFERDQISPATAQNYMSAVIG
ncbi:Phage integrase family protein (fragment) [Vibrio diabolicus]